MIKAALLLITGSVMWGISWIPLDALARIGIDGLWLLFVSHGILALILILYIKRKSLSSLSSIPIKEQLIMALAGGGAIVLFTLAVMYGKVVMVMALFFLLPVWGSLLGWLLLGESMTPLRVVNVLIAVGGAWLVLGHLKIIDSPPGIYELMGLGAGFLFAVNNVSFRRTQSISLESKTAVMFIGCSGLALIGVLLGFGKTDISAISMPAYGWLILYTFAYVLVANLCSQFGVTNLENGTAAILIVTELIAAVLSTLLLKGNNLDVVQWFGCALICSAAVLEGYRLIVMRKDGAQT